MQHPTPQPEFFPAASLGPMPIGNAVQFINATCAFLQRADLKGAEVQTYAEVFNALQAIGNGELLVIEASAVAAVKAVEDELATLKAHRAQVLEAEAGSAEVRAAVAAFHASKHASPEAPLGVDALPDTNEA